MYMENNYIHRLMNHRSKFGADYLHICRDTAVFVTGLHGTTTIAKTAIFMRAHAIRDRNVGLQSSTTPRPKAFHSFNVSG